MIILREYQTRSINMLYTWFERHPSGNPCLVLPTGSGKSVIIAELCRDAIQSWPETRILVLSHVKELLEQDADKILAVWPEAPVGIYSASIGMKRLAEPITVAGIQSIRKRASEVGHIDLVIVDECFPAGAKVLTPSGEVNIEKMRCGDIILNLGGVGVVEAISRRNAKETFLLEVDDGRTIECTGNHRFLTKNGWNMARELENGTYLFGLEDVCRMWEGVPPLDQKERGRNDCLRNAGISMGEAAILLGGMCEEAFSDSFGCECERQDKTTLERNKAQAYSALRKRVLASFASVGPSSCLGGWVGGRSCGENRSGTSERDLSECVQAGHSEHEKKDCDRGGWGISYGDRKTRTRSEKNTFLNGGRLARISRIKRKGLVPVFNLQVSGHPSYFVNGIATHNCHLINHK
ncbi:MAG: DEAD/DEAH box helicase family protein, partial [Candidatus Omnitrophota bacterium]